jgi:hypothetical protein
LIDAVFGEQHRETAAVIGLDRVGEGHQQRCERSVADGFRLARAYRWSGALCCTDQHPGAVRPSQQHLREANVLRPVSRQLNVKAYRLALTKVYTFGPTFRAENSNTGRHIAEFWMIAPEIPFADLSNNATLAAGLTEAC